MHRRSECFRRSLSILSADFVPYEGQLLVLAKVFSIQRELGLDMVDTLNS